MGQRNKISGDNESWKPLPAVYPCPVLPGSSSLELLFTHAKPSIFTPYYSLKLKWLILVLGQMLTLPVRKWEYLL